MKQHAYKVMWGRFSTLHNSKTAALKKAKQEGGTAFEHNPFALPEERDHSDELGQWVKL